MYEIGKDTMKKEDRKKEFKSKGKTAAHKALDKKKGMPDGKRFSKKQEDLSGKDLDQ